MARVNVLRPGAAALAYATAHSAGLDLVACLPNSTDSIELKPGESISIPAGISLSLNDDQVALIYARSGLGIKHGITLRNGTGVIDADYKGEVIICLVNQGDCSFVIPNGMRVAQIVITKFERFDNVTIKEAVRGEGGFGSTGH